MIGDTVMIDLKNQDAVIAEQGATTTTPGEEEIPDMTVT